MDLAVLKSVEPTGALKTLLEKRKLEFPAKVPIFTAPAYPESEWSDEQKRAREEYLKQTRLLKKLRDIADDALEYLNDHGESCLAIGFPLLSVPPSVDDSSSRSSARVLAPLLLMPVNLQVRTASRAGVTIECTGEGTDLLVANPSLIAWLERNTGKDFGEIYLDDEAVDPWREIHELLQQVNAMLGLDPPPEFHADTLLEGVAPLEKLPKEVSVLRSAVLGLFPLSNQSLLRDTRWMIENKDGLQQPVSSFLNPQALLDTSREYGSDGLAGIPARDFNAEWLISHADPCQANAVLAAREANALVVHGPPGTGKSQTIANMIADHLARGERVLFVCDKRTALDVVKYRLDAVGIGDLCGVVHDPSGDRKDFYMNLRTKLENLADSMLVRDPRPNLAALNQQLAAIHAELEGYRQKLHFHSDGAHSSFHELLGSWLHYSSRTDLLVIKPIPELRLGEVESAATVLDEICRRAEKIGYPDNPFRDLVGISLSELLARSSSDIRACLEAIAIAAKTADEFKPPDFVTRFEADAHLDDQGAVRESAAAQLRSLTLNHDPTFLRTVTTMPGIRRKGVEADVSELDAWLQEISASPLDRSLFGGARSSGILTLATVNQHLASLSAYEAIAGSFFKRLFGGATKSAATAALTPLGLTLQVGWQQGLAFYRGVKWRLLVSEWLDRVMDSPAVLRDDETLHSLATSARTVWEVESKLASIGFNQDFGVAVCDVAQLNSLAKKLEGEATWIRKLGKVCELLLKSGVFTKEAVPHVLGRWFGEEDAGKLAIEWRDCADTLEDLVRLRSALTQLTSSMARETEALMVAGANFGDAMDCFRMQATENVLRERLKNDPELAAIDGERIAAAFDSFLKLSQDKLLLVGDYIHLLWVHHQKSRLLASTGNQLNKLGASLRQRLYVRGKKALKLRQMLATGEQIEGGDPIYDLCPVWMASPSTVAQIFPKVPIFNVVIFDEASQCRLEEALPVLLRGRRVVIAGDQKQLPPTRFFESALADSGDGDAETAEELFYQQQQEAEDLLTASLNLEVRESYLDVHYRSRNEALIGFSNEQFYGSRLQPIPGHPRNKALTTPIQLHHVGGIYHERSNEKEAEAVVNLIADLLSENSPPSIGVACFNLNQRDTIHEAIAARANSDVDFARRFEEAKHRKGRDSFEGLFVKNLENVQGDERDVMIISTTFGPDKQGKYRRNLGVLSQREGGRRLNVLVTRARIAVHVFTSIPTSEYSVAESTPAGQIPNGRLQLYAYLRYAEKLATTFGEYQDELEKMRRDAKPELKIWQAAIPSALAKAFGGALLDRHQTGCHVHWGNDGFCVDVACVHPHLPADVTVGVLTDFSRYHKTPDPIEWDIFRTRVLRSQGWELERLWSPVLFRRADEMLDRIKTRHEHLAAADQAKSTLVAG